MADAMSKLYAKLATGSLAPGFEKCHEHLRDQVEENFREGGSPLGTWAPHAAGTIGARRDGSEIPTHPLLIFTGEMAAAAVGPGMGHIETTAARHAEFGTDHWKAPFHQFGTSRIPERPFMVVGDEALDACAEDLADAAIEILMGGD